MGKDSKPLESPKGTEGDESVFNQYVRHSDILRNWFVAYGIGGILLFLTKDSFFSKVPMNQLFSISIWLIRSIILNYMLIPS